MFPIKPRRKINKILSAALLLLLFVAAILAAFELCMRPLAMTVCTFEAKRVAGEAVNLVSIDLAPMVLTDDIISVNRDEYGRIVAITTNSNAIATFAAALAQDIQDMVNNGGDIGVDIRISEVLGGQAMSGSGPAIHMSFKPTCVVETEVRSEFEAVGINQTRHCMVADMKVRVRVTLPLQTTFVDFEATTLLAETIIVGTVPETYLNSYDGESVKYDLIPGE